jgi:chemotaxis protein methyltransferase CheR
MSALADDWLARLRERIGERLGLGFAAQREDDLVRALTRVAGELGLPGAAECASQLLCEPWDRQRVELLAAHLTIGETYFFRDPALFEALGESVLPALIRHGARSSPRLRLWSAGCCTGEEAYSLAIVASQVLARFPGWSAQVRATDVNPRFLEKAAAGRYGPWSFRGMPAGSFARYFLPIGGERYVVRPDIRGLVEFGWDNLVDPPGDAARVEADVIVCRNVLMYFTPAQMRRAIRRFHDALAPGGWLVVSPSEGAAQRFPEFAPVMRGGVLLFRKKGAEDAIAPAPQGAPAPPIAAWSAPSATPSAPSSSSQAPDAPQPGAAAHDAGFAARARECADRGALDEALVWCERWLAASRLDPAAHYLHAMVLLERNQRAAARAALVRALYLDPAHVMSHVACGNLARAEGVEDEAQRHFRNALRLVEDRHADAPLADSDGLHAGALRETLAALLEAPHPA